MVSYFTAVRLYSLLELALFAALMVVALGGLGEGAELVLGWSHGVGWILLCVAVAVGCGRRVFPWPLLAATVSPLGPLGSTLGLEYLSAARRRVAHAGGPSSSSAGRRTVAGGGSQAEAGELGRRARRQAEGGEVSRRYPPSG